MFNAVMMLPMMMDITKKTVRSPSQGIMPFASGSLLSSPLTLMSTPVNILGTEVFLEAENANA
jgi:hypothetical protein